MQSETLNDISVIRWVSILLRTVHLIGVAGVGGAFFNQVPTTAWLPYIVLVIVSGAAMLLLDILSNYECLFQVRGVVTMVKIMLLIIAVFVGMQAYMLITVIAISGVISHAPAKVRYFYLVKGIK